MSNTLLPNNMKRFLRLFFAAITTLCVLAAQPAMAAGKKVALIIGNSTYVNGTSLPNPLNDAALVAKTAMAAGFEVTQASNLNADDFHKTLTDFQTKADTAEVALVYYAGHGIENNFKNWLIPTDAVLTDPRDLQRQAISFDEVLNTVALSKYRIILLDACRDDPYKAKWGNLTRSFAKGLADVTVDTGTIVLFATDAGATVNDGGPAGNSFFATAISKNLAKPGEPLSRLANNITRYVTDVSGGLQRPKKAESLPNDLTLIPIIAEDSSEYAVWGKATKLNTVPAYQEYLDKFPNGQFKNDAMTSIRVLSRSGPAPLPPSAPPQTPQFKMLPGLGAAPQFYAGSLPSCRDSWNGLSDTTAKLAAIDGCLGAYRQYESGTLSPFAAQMTEHVRQVQSLATNTVEPDPAFTDAQKAEFRASVQSRVQDASEGGALMQGYLSAKRSVEQDTASLIETKKSLQTITPITPPMPLPEKKPCDDPYADKNNCIAVAPILQGPPITGDGIYRAPPIQRKYGAGGFPIMPDPPVFDYGPYPTCKDSWLTISDPMARVNATIACGNAFTDYQTNWLNRYRVAMNAYGSLVGEIYTNEVAPPRYPTLEREVQQFYAEMDRRIAGVKDGGYLMADYEKAKARFKADSEAVKDTYYRATGCKGYPVPAGLAPNPNC